MIHASVCILTKNPGPIFKEVLEATLAQKTDWEFEVIVVDSGSTDGTIEYLNNWPKVRLIQIPAKDFGHGKTRNLAVSHARGRFVAMLTHDAKPYDVNWLSEMVKPFDEDSKVAGVFGRHYAYESATIFTKRDLQGHFDHFLEWPRIVGLDDPKRYEADQGYRQVLHYFSDNNACLRKEVWAQLPYPDVNFAEDQIWAKAIIEAGYRKAYATHGAVYHSHDYSINETFRRSYDESNALRQLFGYVLCPSLPHAMYQTMACSKRDIRFALSKLGLGKGLSQGGRQVAVNLAKQLGFWIGAKPSSDAKWFFRLISLDEAKKRE